MASLWTMGIAYSNRGTDGSGHGWDAGWAVAWNVTTPDLLVQQPPGVDNWCIGCVGAVVTKPMPGGDGTPLPNGIYDSLGMPVVPPSLYLEQLRERLGVDALVNIGYGDFVVSNASSWGVVRAVAVPTTLGLFRFVPGLF